MNFFREVKVVSFLKVVKKGGVVKDEGIEKCDKFVSIF